MLYKEAEKLFTEAGFDTVLDGPDEQGNYSVKAIPTQGDGDSVVGYAVTPELAIRQAWAIYDASR